MTSRCLLPLLLLGACEQTAPAPSQGLTLFDFADATDAERPVLPPVEGFANGLPYNDFVSSHGPVVTVSPAITEGGWSPYVSTNLWLDMPEVWIQPMYVLVTGYNAQTRDWTRLKDERVTDPMGNHPNAGWIFTVGPKSRFHSPFWRIYFAQVPAGTKAGDYTSSQQILRDRLPLTPGPGRLAPLVPSGTSVGGLPPGPAIAEFQPPKVRQLDYLDGEQVASLDFGNERFEWNEDGEVIEQPLFVLVTCASSNHCDKTGAPSIGGTGPLFARRPAIAAAGKPRFGSFWRLHTVALPNNGQVGLFVPPSVTAEVRNAVRGSLTAGFEIVDLAFTPDPTQLAEVDKHFMQVALNARDCLTTAEKFAGCQWLDSQRALEELLPQAITRTRITVTCPFVGYAGMDVKE